MPVSPRYEGPPIISIAGAPDDQRIPLIRQRKRFEEMLVNLSTEEWGTASRCDGWTVQDVAAHLVGVNTFSKASVLAGLAGSPTRLLVGFDPATTPALMVDQMHERSPGEILDQFMASNQDFLDVMAKLDDRDWMAPAESPAGHIPIRLVAHHALWDCWIHERDIGLPLGLFPPTDDDEIAACLHYVVAFSGALAISSGRMVDRVFAVQAGAPTLRFVLGVGETAAIRDGVAPLGVPCLRGDAVALVEALSIRTPLPDSAPTEWLELRDCLATVFTSTLK
jgi:uncharacterized protein (TIGR03083 family)